jgi:hypothetical protein
MEIQITCINKDNGNHANKHEGISRFGWTTGSQSGYFNRPEMVSWLERGNTAFVRSGISKTYCYVRISPSTRLKFVQTVANNTPTDNLLNLLECRL